MHRIFATLSLVMVMLATGFSMPSRALAAGGIYASGGGTKTVGQSFTVTVAASGVTFDSLQGQISVSGPVSVVSFNAGSGTWLPGKSPSNGGTFVGITSATSSLTVATITLKGTSAGSGSVSVNGPKLAKSGAVVSTDGGGTSFTITRAPTPPSSVSVSSSSHPDQNSAYENKTIELSWTKASGVTAFSYGLDQSATTTPSGSENTNTSAKYENKDVGTYYFHIRAKNGDGWSSTTHYKIAIKEPDAKVDETATKPTIAGFTKTPEFKSNLDEGTVQGFIIKGTVRAGFKANLSIIPEFTLPEGRNLTAETKEDGSFEYLVDFPVKSGFYKLTVQGQQDKTLTPMSDTYKMEASVSRGGTVKFITDRDAQASGVKIDFNDYTADAQRDLVYWTAGSILAFLIGLALTAWFFLVYRKNKPLDKGWKKK